MSSTRQVDLLPAVVTLVRHHLPPESAPLLDADPHLDLLDAGLDSLALVGLIVEIEETFTVRFPAASIDRATFASVDTILDALRGLSPS
jgi:acyl carrier protein